MHMASSRAMQLSMLSKEFVVLFFCASFTGHGTSERIFPTDFPIVLPQPHAKQIGIITSHKLN